MAAFRSSRRSKFDDDGWEPSFQHTDHPGDPSTIELADGFRSSMSGLSSLDGRTEILVEPEPDQPSWSTYVDSAHGPEPVPEWVVTEPRATDTDFGVLKSGKEADVSLLQRTAPDGKRCLLAVKQYRSSEHRMFHRDAGYLEGRRVRRSREMRAMATRTEFGRELIAGRWAAAEFDVLSRLWSVGAAVPYPVQLSGTELMMEFIGSQDGVAAPRLAQTRPVRDEARSLYQEMVDVLVALADAGYAHGDLSPYNVLVHDGRIVLIDLPQAVDLVGNPQGFDYLRRDCMNIAIWFAAHGVPEADADDLHRRLVRSVPGLGGS
jgi:RIO kinase 1